MITTEDRGTFWEREAGSYVAALRNDYHAHRLQVIRSLIPAEIISPDKFTLDFGCGDGVIIEEFRKAGANHIDGIDKSSSMVSAARLRLLNAGLNNYNIDVGDVETLKRKSHGSYDAILCFNTLAYLSDSEEQSFYVAARRLVKPGGYLIVTHCNELFELFGLNQYTAEFFRRHLVDDGAELPPLPGGDRVAYNIRENPMAYRHKLAGFGFREVRQEFINRHTALPSGPKDYPDTLNVPESERWKLMFQCSTFGSVSTRDQSW